MVQQFCVSFICDNLSLQFKVSTAEESEARQYPSRRKRKSRKRKGGRRRTLRDTIVTTPKSTWVQSRVGKDFIFSPDSSDGYSSTSLESRNLSTLSRPSYGGFGVASGELDSRHALEEVAVGIPRAPNAMGILTGKVISRTGKVANCCLHTKACWFILQKYWTASLYSISHHIPFTCHYNSFSKYLNQYLLIF